MAEKTDSIENILSNGIDLKNRRIYFGALLESYDESGSDFTWRSCEWAIRAIHMMEAEAPHKPIELHMSSPGGDPYAMLRLMDVIQSSSCQVKFYGGGEICSAATWVMAICDERYLYPNTLVLIHDSSAGGTDEVPAKLSDAYIHMDAERLLQDRLNQIFADNSRMPKEFWDEFVKRDLYLSAEETIALGLADKVIEYKKRGNLRRMRMAALRAEPDMKELNKLVKRLKDRTYMNKTLKIELHVPQESKDKNVFVETTSSASETPTPHSGTQLEKPAELVQPRVESALPRTPSPQGGQGSTEDNKS
jgi:ATP-dependent Clp protease, protease subunit